MQQFPVNECGADAESWSHCLYVDLAGIAGHERLREHVDTYIGLYLDGFEPVRSAHARLSPARYGIDADAMTSDALETIRTDLASRLFPENEAWRVRMEAVEPESAIEDLADDIDISVELPEDGFETGADWVDDIDISVEDPGEDPGNDFDADPAPADTGAQAAPDPAFDADPEPEPLEEAAATEGESDPPSEVDIAAELARFREDMAGIASSLTGHDALRECVETFRGELGELSEAITERVGDAAQTIDRAAQRVEASAALMPDPDRLELVLTRNEASAAILERGVRQSLVLLLQAVETMAERGALPGHSRLAGPAGADEAFEAGGAQVA